MARPRGIRDAGDARPSDRLETPPILACRHRSSPTDGAGHWIWRHRLRSVTGIHGSLVYPLGEIGDDRLRELRAILGHPGVRVRVSNLLEEEALSGVSRIEGRTGFSTAEKPAPKIYPQTALLLLGPVAFVAFVGEDRTDALLKMLQQIWGGRLGCLN